LFDSNSLELSIASKWGQAFWRGSPLEAKGQLFWLEKD